MENERPPATGRLIVVEPFVPEGQYEREFTAIEPNVGYEPTWIFEVTEPIGWKGAMTNRLLLSPRGGAWSDRMNGDLNVSGCSGSTTPPPRRGWRRAK